MRNRFYGLPNLYHILMCGLTSTIAGNEPTAMQLSNATQTVIHNCQLESSQQGVKRKTAENKPTIFRKNIATLRLERYIDTEHVSFETLVMYRLRLKV